MSSNRQHSTHRANPKRPLALIGAGLLATTTATTASEASADLSAGSGDGVGADDAVFVQGNELDGNTIHTFARGDDGQLTPAGKYETGGRAGHQKAQARLAAWARATAVSIRSVSQAS